MKIKIPVKNKVQIIPKTIHAKKDMWLMETCSSNTIAAFNAKQNGAIVKKYFILIRYRHFQT